MPPNTKFDKVQSLYTDIYFEIGCRLKVIFEVTAYEGRNAPLWQSPHHSVEFCALQLRKVFELMMIGCLAPREYMFNQFLLHANEEGYGDRVYRNLLRINPHFFPVPIKKAMDQDGQLQWVTRVGNFLAQEEFLRVYNRDLHEYLHEDNLPSAYETEGALKSLKATAQKTLALINHHRTQLSFEYYVVCVLKKMGEEPEVHLFELLAPAFRIAP
jgi:hypothetical protein